jgi:hypothetical protein
MKHTSSMVAALGLLIPCGLHSAEPSSPLTQDSVQLSSAKGMTFQSAVLDLQLADGSHARQILVMEFAPFPQGLRENPPHASVKLSLASPTKGIKGLVEVSTSVGNARFNDVRLQEKDGVRMMTITRAIETVDRPKPKTQRILDQNFSSSFTYELKDDTLTLKGFAKDGTKWGTLQFIAPEREITFKAVK